jgi:hypothetical protein
VLRPAAACEVPDFRGLHLQRSGSHSTGAAPPPYDEAEALRRRTAVADALTRVRQQPSALRVWLKLLHAASLTRSRARGVCALQHRIPWAETSGGGLLVLGCLTLVWPFTADAATCPNSRVLEQVAALLDAAAGSQSATPAAPDHAAAAVLKD